MSGVLLTEDITVGGCSPPGGVIAVWTLNRPEKLNALNRDSHLAIKEQCVRVESDDTVRAVVIRGAAPPPPEEGKQSKPAAFAAGADISEFVGKNSDDVREFFANKRLGGSLGPLQADHSNGRRIRPRWRNRARTGL